MTPCALSGCFIYTKKKEEKKNTKWKELSLILYINNKSYGAFEDFKSHTKRMGGWEKSGKKQSKTMFDSMM